MSRVYSDVLLGLYTALDATVIGDASLLYYKKYFIL